MILGLELASWTDHSVWWNWFHSQLHSLWVRIMSMRAHANNVNLNPHMSDSNLNLITWTMAPSRLITLMMLGFEPTFRSHLKCVINPLPCLSIHGYSWVCCRTELVAAHNRMNHLLMLYGVRWPTAPLCSRSSKSTRGPRATHSLPCCSWIMLITPIAFSPLHLSPRQESRCKRRGRAHGALCCTICPTECHR